jgi:predicted nucleotidyltransferase component of viral defense system
MLQQQVLDAATLDLLRKISGNALFSEYRLVGGTALALQFGHRISVDLDFFGNQSIDETDMIETLSSLGVVVRTIRSPRIQSFFVNDIKVDVVCYPYQWLDVPVDEDNIRLASIKDIAPMKLAAITNRGTKKDFVDLDLLLNHLSLSEMLNLYRQKYSQDSDFFVLRSLTYFEDAEQNSDPEMLTAYNWETIKKTIIKAVSHLVS